MSFKTILGICAVVISISGHTAMGWSAASKCALSKCPSTACHSVCQILANEDRIRSAGSAPCRTRCSQHRLQGRRAQPYSVRTT